MLNTVHKLGALFGIKRPENGDSQITQNIASLRSARRASFYALLGAGTLGALAANGCVLDRYGSLPAGSGEGGSGAEGGSTQVSVGGSGGTGGVEDGGGGTGGMETGGGGIGGCEPTVPSTEVCDGIDNDCDSNTEDGSDDIQIGMSCDNSLLGECFAEGVFQCDSGMASCDAPVISPGTETCDNKDDGCTGTVDYDSMNNLVCSPVVVFKDEIDDCYQITVVESDLSTVDTNQSTPSGACEAGPVTINPIPGQHAFLWDNDQVTLQITTLEDAFPGLMEGEDPFDINGDYNGVANIKCSINTSEPTHQEQIDDYNASNYQPVPIVNVGPTLYTIALNSISCPGNIVQLDIPFSGQ